MSYTDVGHQGAARCSAGPRCQVASRTDGLTLGLGADEARRGVAEGAQDGADGQAQVLVAGVQRHGGEAEVGHLRRLLRSDLHVGDLTEGRRAVYGDAGDSSETQPPPVSGRANANTFRTKSKIISAAANEARGQRSNMSAAARFTPAEI